MSVLPDETSFQRKADPTPVIPLPSQIGSICAYDILFWTNELVFIKVLFMSGKGESFYAEYVLQIWYLGVLSLMSLRKKLALSNI